MWLPQIDQLAAERAPLWRPAGPEQGETAAKHGEEQVKIWRRSFDVTPPPLALDDPMHPSHDPRYAGVAGRPPAGHRIPEDHARPRHALLGRGDRAASCARPERDVAAHGNSLRALAKHLFKIGDQDIIGLEIPTGNPILIELDGALAPVSARYLDGSRAGQAAADRRLSVPLPRSRPRRIVARSIHAP